MGGESWDVMDLVKYLMSSPEHAGRVMNLKIFPCSDGERRRIHELFVPTDVHRELALPVIECNTWDFNYGNVNRLRV